MRELECQGGCVVADGKGISADDGGGDGGDGEKNSTNNKPNSESGSGWIDKIRSDKFTIASTPTVHRAFVSLWV